MTLLRHGGRVRHSQKFWAKLWRKSQGYFWYAMLVGLILSAILLTGRGVWLLLQEEEEKVCEKVELIFDGVEPEDSLLGALVASVKTKEELVDRLEQELGVIATLEEGGLQPLICCQYQAVVAYCSRSSSFGLTRSGQIVYVDPSKRTQKLPILILPCSSSDMSYYRTLQPILAQLLEEVEALQEKAPDWTLEKIDLSEYEGEGRVLHSSGIDGGSYFGDIVLAMHYHGRERDHAIYFRMGYGSCIENCRTLRGDTLFHEVLSPVHPIWKKHHTMLFDLRFPGSIYYKAH